MKVAAQTEVEAIADAVTRQTRQSVHTTAIQARRRRRFLHIGLALLTWFVVLGLVGLGVLIGRRLG